MAMLYVSAVFEMFKRKGLKQLKVKRLKVCMVRHGNPSQSYRASLACSITQCYLPANISEQECFPPEPQPDTLVRDLPTVEGWKAELT